MDDWDISGTLIDGRWQLSCSCGWTAETEGNDPDEADPLAEAHIDNRHPV